MKKLLTLLLAVLTLLSVLGFTGCKQENTKTNLSRRSWIRAPSFSAWTTASAHGLPG